MHAHTHSRPHIHRHWHSPDCTLLCSFNQFHLIFILNYIVVRRRRRWRSIVVAIAVVVVVVVVVIQYLLVVAVSTINFDVCLLCCCYCCCCGCPFVCDFWHTYVVALNIWLCLEFLVVIYIPLSINCFCSYLLGVQIKIIRQPIGKIFTFGTIYGTDDLVNFFLSSSSSSLSFSRCFGSSNVSSSFRFGLIFGLHWYSFTCDAFHAIYFLSAHIIKQTREKKIEIE